MNGNSAYNEDLSFRAGAVCTVASGNGRFGAIKILCVTAVTIDVAIYKNKYAERPGVLDLSELSLGSVNDTDGFGIGLVTLARDGFLHWEPVVVGFEELTKEEEERVEQFGSGFF